MAVQQFESKLTTQGERLQPLYKQVEEHVKQLILEQRWKPGDMLPNENLLAKGVSVEREVTYYRKGQEEEEQLAESYVTSVSYDESADSEKDYSEYF